MRLLRLDIRCPTCHRSPRFRIAECEREAHEQDEPGRVLATIQCHGCDRIYQVTAHHYQRAA